MSDDARRPAPLPREVLDVVRRLRTFERLEVLVNMHRRGTRTISAANAAVIVGLPSSTVTPLLDALVTDGFLRRGPDGNYGYEPATPQLASAVDALVKTCAQDIGLVLAAITESTARAGRGSAARSFADAFVLRAAKRDGEED